MDWALNSADDHVRAGTAGADAYSLRCPVCNASVYHRHGVYNRPHFAHYSRNFNRACELYHPGTGTSNGTRGAATPLSAQTSFESPALIWRDDCVIPLALQLRLPKVPNGYASTLTVFSSRGRRVFLGEDLSRTMFAQLSLQEPPARIETSPRDPATEMRVEHVLHQFRLSGNFFRATANGGVLEPLDASLELGQEYFHVSQRALPTPYPPALILTREPRQHRSWNIYSLLLRDDISTRRDDITALESYLGRAIAMSRHHIGVIWPPPYRIDVDGAPVFADTSSQLIVRSYAGAPKVQSRNGAAVMINDLGDSLYQVTFDTPGDEAIVWAPSGSIQRIRFGEICLSVPGGVMLVTSSSVSNLISLSATELADQPESIHISVPTELLWRNASLNDENLRPLPNGTAHFFEDQLWGIDFGAFGSVVAHQCSAVPDVSEDQWYAKIYRIVSVVIGSNASASMRSIRSKQEATRWAIENKAIHLLPLVLSAFRDEVNRGLS